MKDLNAEAKKNLLALLKETVTLTNAVSGPEYDKNMQLLSLDRRWTRMHCVEEMRRKIFHEYIRNLPDTIPSLQKNIDDQRGR